MSGIAWVLLLTLSVLWGATFFFWKVLVEYLPPFTAVFGRVGKRISLAARAPENPKPGYVEMMGAAARAWKLPERHIRSVERWSISRFTGARLIDAGELA